MEVENLIDGIVEAISIKHGVENLLKQIQETDRWINKRCGNCQYWMTRQCPLERNVNGRNHGPSMKAYGCAKFIVKPYQVGYRNEEIKDILASKYIKYIKESYLISIGLLKLPTEVLGNC